MASRAERDGLLEVEDLRVAFPSEGGWVPVVRGVSLRIGAGEIVGLVGESGSGKSLTALSLLRLVPSPGCILGGRVRLAGRGGSRDLLELPETEMRKVRGARIAMIFQEPMTALNPVFTVGFQVVEAIRAHRKIPRRAARKRAVELFERVAIPDAGRRLDDYPHQLSGGQRQRVMIAMALAGEPDLLLADEPTTALDVTIQAQILTLLGDLRRELGLAILLITHDLAVVAETCDRVGVMYAGRVVEEGRTAELFRTPAHPYTRGLLQASPRLGRPAPRGRLPVIEGQVPDPARLPPGCPFHPRCRERLDQCSVREPAVYAVAPAGSEPAAGGHRARCFLHEPVAGEGPGASR
jgi:oligopeptide/dipeptide ABC transporter ATP-binding protein